MSKPCNCIAIPSMEDPSRPILTQSPCTSHNLLLWHRWDDENFRVRLQCLRRIIETPHASNTDTFARVMRLVATWETADFYLPMSAAHPEIFEAADLGLASTVSSGPSGRGACGRAGEPATGSGAGSSRPPLVIRPRTGPWEDATIADRHLAIVRGHGWGASRATKRTRPSSDDEA